MQGKVIEGLVPPSGWHYMFGDVRIPPEGHDVDGYASLLRAVQDYKLDNGLPVGNVKADVDGYICGKFPHCCRHASRQVPVEVVKKVAQQRFVDRISAWGIANARKKHNHVLEQDAYDRARICVQCKYNKQWENSCPTCVENAQRMLALIRVGRDLPASVRDRLHGCVIHNFCCRTAAWLDLSELQAADNAPNECWVKKHGAN